VAELAPIKFEMPGDVERPRSRGRSAANTVGNPVGPISSSSVLC